MKKRNLSLTGFTLIMFINLVPVSKYSHFSRCLKVVGCRKFKLMNLLNSLKQNVAKLFEVGKFQIYVSKPISVFETKYIARLLRLKP